MKKAILIGVCVVSIVASSSVALFCGLDAGGAIELTPKESFLCEFRNYDDSFLWKSNVYYGENASYKGTTPVRKEDQRYSYSFANWDLSLDSIKENTTFHAQFFSTAKYYKATFQNYDHTTLYVDSVPFGGTPAYQGETPQRKQDQACSYVFAGWDVPIGEIYQDTTYTAVYEKEPRKYEVTFHDGENQSKVLYVANVDYDQDAAYVGVTPTKRSTVSADYVFNGWDKNLSRVHEDFDTYPLFEEKKVEFKVDFLNYDGALLYTDYVSYGGTADYFGALPTRPNDEQYHYEFSGWNQALTNVTSNATLTARFYKTLRHFTVNFKNYDGTLLDASDVEYGRKAVFHGSTPKRPQDEKYTYTFSGWDRDISRVTSDFEAYALYTKELRKFTVTFANYDGAFLEKNGVNYGQTAVYFGATPVRSGDSAHTYKFIGWDKELKNIHADTTFIAQFELESNAGGYPKPHYVEFDNVEGSKLDADYVNDGAEAFYRGLATPSRASNNGYTYIFTSWDKADEMKAVTRDFITFAQYKTDQNQFIVTYRGINDVLLYEDYVNPAKSSAYGGPAEDYLLRENHFLGWSKDLSCITDSITVYPTWEKTT